MSALTKKEVTKLFNNMPSAGFTNEYGEKFIVYSNGVTVFISGDEVDMMVDDKRKVGNKYVPLFSEAFNIWSAEELYKLGKALMEIHADAK